MKKPKEVPVDELYRQRLRDTIVGKTVVAIAERDDVYDGMRIEFDDGTVLEMGFMAGIGWVWEGVILEESA